MVNINIYILSSLIAAFLVSYYIIPKIAGIVRYKKLMDDPCERSSHTQATPNLGGITFFITVLLSFYFINRFDVNHLAMSIIPGMVILFISGLKDDLVVLSPRSKLSAQIVSALFLVFHESFTVDTLHGFMGIENMPFLLSASLSVLAVVTIINAINLIDGIDGLASSVAIIMFVFFGTLFYVIGDFFLSLISAVMTGSLIAFLRFNLSPTRKIFMGDTGSMILGFLLGFMVIRVFAIEPKILQKLPFQEENLPYVVAAILLTPLFDTARVFIVRILRGKSPFSADRSHIHHLIIDYYKISHRRASFCIGLVNFLLILLFGYLAISINQWYLLMVFSTFLLVAVLFFSALDNLFFVRKIKMMFTSKFTKK